jgi:hypothetical protein
METIKLLGVIAIGLFALAGVLSEIAIIIILRTVRNGGQLVFGYSEEEDEEVE